MQHALQLDHVGTFDPGEGAVTQPAARGVVDALHLGHGLGVFADLDRERDVVAAAARVVGVGHLDRRRLQVAPAPVAALRLPRLERQDHALGQRHAEPFRGLERRRHRLDHLRARP
jgi:hypothetical protein